MNRRRSYSFGAFACAIVLGACQQTGSVDVPDSGVRADGARDATDSSRPIVCLVPEDVDLSGPRAPERIEVDPDPIDRGYPLNDRVDRLPVDTTLFPLAVQSGAMRFDSAILWTKVVDGAEVMLVVWRQNRDGKLIEVARRNEVPRELFVHARVLGLAPATHYFYTFVRTGPGGRSRSAIGQFNTAPPPGSRPRFRFGATTCTGSGDLEYQRSLMPYRTFLRYGELDLDAFIHVGDIVYNDGRVGLDAYRESWAEAFSDPGYQATLTRHGWYTTWDDHEVFDNWNPETTSAEQKRVATQTYFEHLPAERGPDGQLWTSYRWGDTAEIFVLDERSERLPSTMRGANAQFISPAQLAWFKSALLASTAHFKVVMASVQFGNLLGVFDASIGKDDRWEGYDAQRADLLAFFEANDIRNLWFISGDIHMGTVGTLERTGWGSTTYEITVGPGASAENVVDALIRHGNYPQDLVYPCDQWLFFHGRVQVTTVIEMDPVLDAVRIVYTDSITGETMFDRWLRQAPRR